MKPVSRMLGWPLLAAGLIVALIVGLADNGFLPFGINVAALGAFPPWFTRRTSGKQR